MNQILDFYGKGSDLWFVSNQIAAHVKTVLTCFHHAAGYCWMLLATDKNVSNKKQNQDKKNQQIRICMA